MIFISEILPKCGDWHAIAGFGKLAPLPIYCGSPLFSEEIMKPIWPLESTWQNYQPCYHSGVDFPWFATTFQSNFLPSGVYNENVGFPEIVGRLRAIARAEEHHGERYKKSLKELEGSSVFKKYRKDCWAYRRCGYIHEGEAPPEKCSSCDHELNYLQVKCKGY